MALHGTDIADCWTLTPADRALVMAKSGANRVEFALLLLFYRAHGRFPHKPGEIEPGAVGEVVQQLGMAGVSHDGLNKADRTWKRHRAEIRALFGYREATVANADMLSDWLRDQVAVAGGVHRHLAALLDARCRELLIEPPSDDRAERIVHAAIYAHDERFCTTILGRVTPTMRATLEALLRPAGSKDEEDPEVKEAAGTAPAVLLQLRGDPGRPSFASVQDELDKLELIRRLELPEDLFDHVLPQELVRYRQRVAVEAPYELRRHPEATRLTWLAAFAHLRGRTLIDDLVDLLIETIHHIGARAERKVDREWLDDMKRVTGKQNLLFEIADASLGKPDGIVREVVFPVVSEETLRDLVKEWKATGPTYRTCRRALKPYNDRCRTENGT